MPVAAVPRYLGQDFREASPGLRFGMYLAIWTDRADQEKEVNKRAKVKSPEGQEVAELLQTLGMDETIARLRRRERRPLPGLWDKNDFAARSAWRQFAELSDADRARMSALLQRQRAMAAVQAREGGLFVLDAQAVAPFTTGLGNEHPLENGFAFLWPYGLPYLPGSGVKGVLRQAARELVTGDWGKAHGWSEAAIQVLFGSEDINEARRGALAFWDVIPQIRGDRLLVEVMTAHQSHYYQKGASPHESGQPNPICFLTVPPGSGFTFHVVCDLPLLKRWSPELTAGDRWKQLLEQAFLHAFDWLGFGAKTAVGYGAMRQDEAAVRKREQAAAEAALRRLSPEQRQIEALRKVFAEERAKGALTANSRTASERMDLLRAAQEWTDPVLRREAAALIRETVEALPWSRKAKKQGIPDRLNALESTP